ncbi:MAG: DNA polymerase III subunit beta [Bacillota bacterium]
MKLNIQQSEFNKGIQIVQQAVSSKSTLSILKGIYLEANKEKGLKLIGNDLEIGIEHWINAEIIEEGIIVLPASELSNIIRELPSDNIFFELDSKNYHVNIECLNSKFTLKGFQGDEFPQLPEVKDAFKINISKKNFYKLLKEVKFSTSTDQTQPALTGALFSLTEKNISLVSTNTYRLAYSIIKNKNNIDDDFKVILPGSTLNELFTLIDNEKYEIEVLLNKNYVRFSFQDIIFISRLIEGKFPDYKQVLPSNFNSTIKVDRKNFLNAVKRASLIAKLESNIISIKIEKDNMIINSSSSEHGKAHEIIEIELDGPEQTIDVDAGYIIDVLKILDEDVVIIKLIDALNPLTITKYNNDDFTYLIMPVRPGA